MRNPNQFIWKTKFKCEGLQDISPSLDYNKFYVSIDLESGYNHVDIFPPPHQKYLGFSWQHRDSILFTVLPFGLSSSSHLFTKLTRHRLGIQSLMYIDNGFIISLDHDSATINNSIVQNTIARSGFVPSKTKCIWNPTKKIQYLGLIIDSVNCKLNWTNFSRRFQQSYQCTKQIFEYQFWHVLQVISFLYLQPSVQ